MRAARQLKRRAEQRVESRRLFTTQAGTELSYSGASTAWKRAVKRAGVRDVHFHDLRAKALTDKEAREGMQAARTMGAHSTEAQTADYVRRRGTRRTGATR
jgi:integrase